MAEWLTPDGVMAMVLLLTTLMGVVAAVLQAAGKKELADKVRAAQGQTETVSRALGVVVKGLERGKKGLDPKSVTRVVEAIREESLKEGTEDVLKPIVAGVRAAPDVEPGAVVKAATTRLDARRVS